MDCTIVPYSSDHASQFLATSKSLEPFVPNSHHDVYFSLGLLGSLAELTTAEFIKALPKISQPVSSVVIKNTEIPLIPAKQKDSKDLDSLSLLRKEVKRRNQAGFQRRTPGIFSTILRNE